MKHGVLSILFIILCITVNAQRKPVQWTGTVMNEVLSPLPFASVEISGTGKGVVGDKSGIFSIVMMPSDSLTVSYMGYKTITLPFPATGSDVVMYDIIMEADTIALKEALVLPWKTYDEFIDDFVHTTLASDNLQRALRNMGLMNSQLGYNMIEEFNQVADPTTNFKLFTKAQQDAILEKNSIIPTYKIMSPYAWAELVEAIRRGDFKQSE